MKISSMNSMSSISLLVSIELSSYLRASVARYRCHGLIPQALVGSSNWLLIMLVVIVSIYKGCQAGDDDRLDPHLERERSERGVEEVGRVRARAINKARTHEKSSTENLQTSKRKKTAASTDDYPHFQAVCWVRHAEVPRRGHAIGIETRSWNLGGGSAIAPHQSS